MLLVEESQVRDQLSKLDIHKSIGPDKNAPMGAEGAGQY